MILPARRYPEFFELPSVLNGFDNLGAASGLSRSQRIALIDVGHWVDSRVAPGASAGVTLALLESTSTDGDLFARELHEVFSGWSGSDGGAHLRMLVLVPAPPRGPIGAGTKLPPGAVSELLTSGYFIGAGSTDAAEFGVPRLDFDLNSPRPALLLRRMVADDLLHLLGSRTWTDAHQTRFGPEVHPTLIERVAVSRDVPQDWALQFLAHLRTTPARSAPGIDPVTGFEDTERLLSGWSGGRRRPDCPSETPVDDLAMLTLQVVNAPELVRVWGHRTFELTLFRIAHRLAAMEGPACRRNGRTGYDELTFAWPAADRRAATAFRDSVAATTERLAGQLEPDLGITARFGLGLRAPGRGRSYALTGHHARAAERARALYREARARSRRASRTPPGARRPGTPTP